MKLLINYSDHYRYRIVQGLNSKTGIREGRFDKVIAYGPRDIDSDFRRKNKEIFNVIRGGGYWLWKPYIVQKALANLKSGDFVFYLDADCFFISSVMPLIKTCLKTQQDIIPFELPYTEKYWTKRDAFILMGCDEPRYTDTVQYLATLFLIRKSDFSERFVDEWLTYAQDERIISDKPNQCGYPNYPGFQGNRHDQTIFSLLVKKYRLQPYSVLNRGCKQGYLRFIKPINSLSSSLFFRERVPHIEELSPFTMRMLVKKYPAMLWIGFKLKYLKYLVNRVRKYHPGFLDQRRRSIFYVLINKYRNAK